MPIYKSRIFRVPDEGQAKALALLGDKDFIAISQDSLNVLFPGKDFDSKQMLSAQASAADAYARRRETEAANPLFANSRGWMLSEAKAHRELARYTRSLHSSLHPYLVKGKAYFEGTGTFDVSLRGNKLSMRHGSLGRSTPPIHTVAVVVFLERTINTVAVSTSIAE
ncbi:MAG TPA: hypothetical protein VGH16_01015 [Candidatus Binatia bacterium]